MSKKGAAPFRFSKELLSAMEAEMHAAQRGDLGVTSKWADIREAAANQVMALQPNMPEIPRDVLSLVSRKLSPTELGRFMRVDKGMRETLKNTPQRVLLKTCLDELEAIVDGGGVNTMSRRIRELAQKHAANPLFNQKMARSFEAIALCVDGDGVQNPPRMLDRKFDYDRILIKAMIIGLEYWKEKGESFWRYRVSARDRFKAFIQAKLRQKDPALIQAFDECMDTLIVLPNANWSAIDGHYQEKYKQPILRSLREYEIYIHISDGAGRIQEIANIKGIDPALSAVARKKLTDAISNKDPLDIRMLQEMYEENRAIFNEDPYREALWARLKGMAPEALKKFLYEVSYHYRDTGYYSMRSPSAFIRSFIEKMQKRDQRAASASSSASASPSSSPGRSSSSPGNSSTRSSRST